MSIMPREVFEIIELTLHLVHAPLQDLNTSLGRDAEVRPGPDLRRPSWS